MSFGFLIRNSVRKITLQQVRFSSIVTCWSCGKNGNGLVRNLFCSQCNALQKPDDRASYFNILGIKETYDVDEEVLTKKYKELQKYLHPDKFANKDDQEKLISEKYSSLVNEAYKTLLQPLSRGIYMLQLRGKEIPEKTEVDNEFLMKIMEKNEQVENAQTEEEIMKLNTENKIKIKELQKQISHSFFDGDMKKAIKFLSILKYYTSIDSQIQAVIRNKGIIR